MLVARERRVFDLLDAQAAIASRAAECLETLVHHWPHRPDIQEQLAATRDESELAAEAVFQNVHETFVTALDREDTLALSEALSVVVVQCERAGGTLAAFDVDHTRETVRRVTQSLAAVTRELATAVGSLPRPDQLAVVLADLRRIQRDGERLLRTALPDLVADAPEQAELMAWSQVYEDLDRAFAAAASAARTLHAIELKTR